MANLKRPNKLNILNFINYKKSLGYKYNNINKFYKIEKLLLDNNIYSLENENKIIDIVSKNVELKKYKNEIIDLIKFNNILNNKSTPLKTKVTYNKSRQYIPNIIKPHIFKDICEYIDKISINEKDNYKYIYSILYRLLYSSGLRINEAISLKIRDIDTINSKIIINNSKNNKSRIIIISDSMNDVLKKYIKIVNPKNYLFEYKNHKINYHTISQFNKKIENYFNIDLKFHDFRHTMATTSFLNLKNQGYDEKEILYYLHIYLGHSNINETEYYFYFNNIIKESRNR